MATITSTPSFSSLSVSGTTTLSGNITWSKPTVPSGATITSCVLTGTVNINVTKGSITATINGTNYTSTSSFSVDLGTSNNTTSLTVSAKGANKSSAGTVSMSNLVYTVTYTQNYIVTFKNWDGSIINSYNSPIDSLFTIPSEPSRSGYRFAGWNSGDNIFTTAELQVMTPEDFGGDVTFTAEFIEIIYHTVVFNDWNGSNISTQSIEDNTYGVVLPPNPSRDGYRFDGWYNDDLGLVTDAEFIYKEYITKDMVFTAQYTQLIYHTVTFKDWNGDILNIQSVIEGEDATPPYPTRDGYRFTGWDGSYTNITSDRILTAQYEVYTGTTDLIVNATTLYLASGDTFQLEAIKIPASSEDTISWSSNNGNISVNSSGLVTVSASSGTATITITSGVATKTCTINAVASIANPTTGLSIEPDVFYVEEGQSQQLNFYIEPSNATYSNVTWSTSDPTIATVDSDGLVTTHSPGSATILAVSYDGKTKAYSDAVISGIVYPETITPESSAMTLNLEERRIIRYSYSPVNAIDDIVITSSDPSIVEIDADNKVHALTAGTCDIVLTSAHNPDTIATISLTVDQSITMLSFAPTGEVYIKGTDGDYASTLNRFNFASISEDSSSNAYLDTSRNLHTSELIVCNSIDDSTRLAAVKDDIKEAINSNSVDDIAITSSDYNQFSTTLSNLLSRYQSAFEAIDTITISENSSADNINTLISMLPTSEDVEEYITVAGASLVIGLPIIEIIGANGANIRNSDSTTGTTVIGRLANGDKVVARGIGSTNSNWRAIYEYRVGATSSTDQLNYPIVHTSVAGYLSVGNTTASFTDPEDTECTASYKSTTKTDNQIVRKYPGTEYEAVETLASAGAEVYILDDADTYPGTAGGETVYQWYHVYIPSSGNTGYIINTNLNSLTALTSSSSTTTIIVKDKTLDLTKTSAELTDIHIDKAANKNWEILTSKSLSDFYGAEEMISVGMTYYNNRDSYLTYGQTNIMTGNKSEPWSSVTVSGKDSPDRLYRKLDCSGFVGLCIRGISFEECLLNQTVYNAQTLEPRTDLYDWATALPRTAAEQCQYCETEGWMIDSKYWHSSPTANDWAGLQIGDLIFYGGKDNGRYLGVYHVAIYNGLDGNNAPTILECTSSAYVENHSDGITKGMEIISMEDKGYVDTIVRVARPQIGSYKK